MTHAMNRTLNSTTSRAGRARWLPRSPATLLALLAVGLAIRGFAAPLGLPATPGETNQTTAVGQVGDPRALLEMKLAEARASLAAAEAVGDTAGTNAPVGVSLQDIATRRALQQRLVRLLEQQLGNTAELATVQRRRAETARAAQAWTRFAEPPPYSVLLTDRLREEIEAEQLKITSGETAMKTIEQLVSENRTMLTHAEENIRLLNEQLEGGTDSKAPARLSWQRELERLRSQVAAATVGVLEAERQLRQEALAESRVRLGWLQRQLVSAAADTRFTQSDLDQVTARIEAERQKLERELTAAQARWNAASPALEEAREALRLARAGSNADPGAVARAAEQVSVREAQLETAQAGIRMLRLMLEIQNLERTMWEMRFAAYDSRNVATLNDSERRLENFRHRSELWQDFQQQQLVEVPNQIELQVARIAGLPPDSELLPAARERLAALREREQVLERLMSCMDHVRRLGERWAEELRTAEGRLPLLGRVQSLFSNAGSFAKKLWTFELFTAEDTITVEGQKITGKRSITLGKIVMAIFILTVGIWITGLVSRLVEPIIIRRLKIEANQASLIRRWLRALLIVCLILFSLTSVKIPLTVFAFAGGALAIGLGFGLQNLLKNFVSGLIILFERPFRVGDVLDVGGQRGSVTSVGLRASVLQLWDGTETLIPNSTLLENNLTNWTYSNRKVRFSVAVGVAYGSDPRRVTQILSDVAERHGLVEKDPKPQVLFTEFGQSTLQFELRFWVDVTVVNAAQVSSDLRLMIVGAFAEQGIVIAFPQRDLHLHSMGPIPVEIVAPAGAKPDPAANPGAPLS